MPTRRAPVRASKVDGLYLAGNEAHSAGARRRSYPGPPNRAGGHHTDIMSGSDTHRAHGMNGLVEGHLAEKPASREGHFLLKLLNMLFQISGAEKVYLKGYGISHF